MFMNADIDLDKQDAANVAFPYHSAGILVVFLFALITSKPTINKEKPV